MNVSIHTFTLDQLPLSLIGYAYKARKMPGDRFLLEKHYQYHGRFLQSNGGITLKSDRIEGE